MTYQVNMVSASDEGFTDAALDEAVERCTLAARPPMKSRRSPTECVELSVDGQLVATLCPAGEEPYDYLLVDFPERRGRDTSQAIQIVARIADSLQLTVFDLSTRLEYKPMEWAAARTPDAVSSPRRDAESRLKQLANEQEFYTRRGVPFAPAEMELLQAAADRPDDMELRERSTEVRDRKAAEERQTRTKRSRWPFGKRHR